MDKHFPIIIEQDEDGVFIVSCPVFAGCHSQGNTVEEAMTNIQEVIELCAEDEVMDESNQFIGIRDLQVTV